jgi:hypothetical protein
MLLMAFCKAGGLLYLISVCDRVEWIDPFLETRIICEQVVVLRRLERTSDFFNIELSGVRTRLLKALRDGDRFSRRNRWGKALKATGVGVFGAGNSGGGESKTLGVPVEGPLSESGALFLGAFRDGLDRDELIVDNHTRGPAIFGVLGAVS